MTVQIARTDRYKAASVIYGDSAAAYSLAEFDTYVRHQLPMIAVVDNDASWSQIARKQVEILGDDCGTS